MEKTKAIIRFILALIILAGFISVFAWANCSHKKSNVQNPIDEDFKCAGGPAEIEHGSVIGWTEDSLYPAKGEMVTFEGYVELPNLTYLNGATYMVNLLQDSTLEGRKLILQINEGDCENTMEPLPNEYDNNDLLIRDNGGAKIRNGEKVRVTGKVTSDKSLYMFWVKRIEKL
jgi:hypothetical protein